MKKEIFSREQKRLLKKLRDARIEAGFTQEQVAKKLSVYQSYVSKIEAGEIKVSAVLLKKLANLYKKDIGFFL